MNTYLFFAAFAAGTMAVGHSVVGEVAFFKYIKNYPKSDFGDEDVTRRLVLGGWHFLAIPLGMTSIGLLILALTPWYFENPKFVAQLCFWHYVGQAVILLWYQIPRPSMFITAPLWIGTIGIPILILIGTDYIKFG